MPIVSCDANVYIFGEISLNPKLSQSVAYFSGFEFK